MSDSIDLPRLPMKEYKRLAVELARLLNVDPRAAIKRARTIPRARIDEGMTTDLLRASILVDAGDAVRDDAAVAEGQEILEQLAKEHPNNADILYCLGNALTSRTTFRAHGKSSWYLETQASRVRARELFAGVGRSDARSDLRTRAITNLGNSLWSAYRWVEAYDTYLQALAIDPSNAIARTGAVKALLRPIRLGLGDVSILRAVAARHLERAKQDRDRIVELAGPAAATELAGLLKEDLTGGEYPDLSRASPYEQFVARERLALSLTIEGLQPNLHRWDSLRLESIIEPLSRGHGVPPVFAMFNVLKADYLAARWLSFVAFTKQAPESGSYADTLDYARYGVDVSLLVLAQRAAMDVLDKIAVFVAEYLGTGEKPGSIKFRERWHELDESTGLPCWRSSVAKEMSTVNPGFIALADAAFDLGRGGYLYSRKRDRNTGTHRFGVIHDLSQKPSRESRYVTHYGEEEFRSVVLDTLRLARSALIYVTEAVGRREARLASGNRLGTLIVPSHEWIRGDDEVIE